LSFYLAVAPTGAHCLVDSIKVLFNPKNKAFEAGQLACLLAPILELICSL
jgi:hypothetical protein